MSATRTWSARPETEADVAAVRAVNLAAFPTAFEADLVDELRGSDAWVAGLSFVAVDDDGLVGGFSLLSRSFVDGVPALTLGPCAVPPEFQGTGAGAAAIRGGLEAARARGENLVHVLGHATYYPRFGFTLASGFGIRPPFEVPDEAMMAMTLDPSRPVPGGTITYPPAFLGEH